MAKKKVTRKELLKETDEFLTFSARAARFVREHSRQFTYLGVAIGALILIYLGTNTYINYFNKKGLETYNTAYYQLVQKMTTPGDQEGLKETQALFQKVTDHYGISKVAPLALPQVAFLRYQEKKYDEAISLYQEFLDEVLDNPPYRSLTWLAIAACYEEKKDYGKAIETLKLIAAQPEGYFKEQAQWQLARIYRLSDQNEKSKEVLEAFVEEFKTSPYRPIAQAYLKDMP